MFADLSKNRLTDFAADICHFVALETLNLYHNCIKTIPDSIISLQSLTSLNIRCTHAWFHGLVSGLKLMIPKPHQLRTAGVWHGVGAIAAAIESSCTPRLNNHLQFKTAAPQMWHHSKYSFCCSRNQICSLPPCLCSLPLRVLNASNNRLDSLPETIGQLSNLMELVWSHCCCCCCISCVFCPHLLVFLQPSLCCVTVCRMSAAMISAPSLIRSADSELYESWTYGGTPSVSCQKVSLWAQMNPCCPLNYKNNSALVVLNVTPGRANAKAKYWSKGTVECIKYLTLWQCVIYWLPHTFILVLFPSFGVENVEKYSWS